MTENYGADRHGSGNIALGGDILTIEDFIKTDEEDERYYIYSVQKAKIFNSIFLPESREDFWIGVSRDTTFEKIGETLLYYMNWLSDCKKELFRYFDEECGEKVSDEWYEALEIYRVSVVINSAEDFSATIVCGDGVLFHHILDINFDSQHIVDVGTTG